MRIFMLYRMRTTLEIEDEVFRRAKVRAAEVGSTLGELVTLALRDALEPRGAAVESRFVMPIFGDASSYFDRSPAALAELRDEGR